MMRKTYCTAKMKFVDVNALNDSTPSTSYNQSIGNINFLNNDADEIAKLNDYATTELNLFVLDGGKTIIDEPEDICFMSSAKSNNDCTFNTNPVVRIDFTENHTSSGITLYFGSDYPAEINVTWYTLAGSKVISKTYYPDSLIFVCSNQIANYGAIEIEFIKTRYPVQYASLQYIKYGVELTWEKDKITSANVLEEVDVTSNTLSINTAKISILDERNDFDIANNNGAWKSVQRTQEIQLTEYIDNTPVHIGSYYINKPSFANNIASFEMIDGIGLLDQYTFYDGRIYNNELAGNILKSIFQTANFKYYSIDDDVYNTTVSGWLEVQTCREALQMVCFSIGAIADDSRSKTIKVYKPNRYVSSTIGKDRKFNGSSKITLDNYVSGVMIGYNTYKLSDKSSNIFEGTLSAGVTKISFGNPYDTSTITSTLGTIKELHTNYLVIENSTQGECVITGTPYEASESNYTLMVDNLDAGETENIVSLGGCTLVNTLLLPDIANKLLNYYQLRKNVELKCILEEENAGNWINVITREGYEATTLIESQNINLTGGFIATSKCKGYTIVNTYDYYTGNELILGVGGII